MTIKKGYGPLCQLAFARAEPELQQQFEKDVARDLKSAWGDHLGTILTEIAKPFLAVGGALGAEFRETAIRNTRLTAEEYSASEAACAVHLRGTRPVLGM